MAKKLKVWNGASWEDVTFAITPPSTNVTNEFTTNQVIDVSTSAAALRITQRGAGEALRVEDSTNPDSSPFVIDASGNVGIGTSSPDRPLKISGNSVSFAIADTSTGGSDLAFNPPQNSSGFAQIDVSGSNALRFNTNSNERMRITSSGNVGISTSSPTDKLDILVPAAVDSGIRFTLTSGGLPLGQITVNSNSGEIKVGGANSTAGNYYLGFYSSGSQRATIDTSGNFNITNGKIFINSTSSVTGGNWWDAMLQITGINDAASNPGMTFHAPGASAVSIYHVRGWQGLSVLGNGNITDTTSGRPVIRNISISTSTPSGGSDGDMWAVYV